jgi:DNA helicase HerA-like ATPase
VNAVCVLDEAHTIASSDDARDGDTVAAEPAQAIRHTRKCHLGFLVATQEIGALAQNVFRGLHTYIFGFGLKNASEQERVKEILADQSAWRIYEQMPDPDLPVRDPGRGAPARQRRRRHRACLRQPD